MTASDISWSELVTQEILQALNMTHSFFGPVPSSLFSDVSVPGGENWVDLIVGSGYDAAAGMWVGRLISSALNLKCTSSNFVELCQ